MGRHSAPDDEEDGDVLLAAPVAAPVAGPETVAGRGRHARAEDDEDTEPVGPQDTAPIAVVEQAAAPAELRTPRVGKGNQSTAADLELLRERSDVRTRVIAAVIAPFVVYTAVLLLIGAVDVYVVWVWLPLVTAGVLAGSILDAAHRKRDRDRPAS